MKKNSSLKAQKGVGLIEVLVSMLILSICLLGMAALQSVALRNGQSAQSRSMAGIMSNSITDAMRANITAARSGAYNSSTCALGEGTGSSLADADIMTWISSLKRSIGQSACGTVLCQAGQCDITVQWDDSRANAGSSAHSVTTRVQL